MMIGFGMLSGLMFLWLALAALVILLVRRMSQINRIAVRVQEMSARQVLDQRYAQGEITQEQYLSMLKDLQ